MNRSPLILLAILTAALGLILLTASCGRGPAGEAATKEAGDVEKRPVRVVHVEQGSITRTLRVGATLERENTVSIFSKIGGFVEEVMAEEGDPVRAGRILAVVSRDEAALRLEEAALLEAEAARLFARATELLGEGLVSDEEYDRLAGEANLASNGRKLAELTLSYCEIRAPFDGTVVRRHVRLGQTISIADPLFVLCDAGPLIAEAHLPERDALELRPEDPVRVESGAKESTPFRGRIRRISPIVDATTGTVKITIEAIDPPGQVRPGSFVNAAIDAEARHDVLLVPKKSVIMEGGERHVFIADNGVAHKRTVTVGLEDAAMVEIVSGLNNGETVVVEGQGRLRDGIEIEIIEG